MEPIYITQDDINIIQGYLYREGSNAEGNYGDAEQ